MVDISVFEIISWIKCHEKWRIFSVDKGQMGNCHHTTDTFRCISCSVLISLLPDLFKCPSSLIHSLCKIVWASRTLLNVVKTVGVCRGDWGILSFSFFVLAAVYYTFPSLSIPLIVIKLFYLSTELKSMQPWKSGLNW